VFTNKKREGINIFVCGVSIYVVETSKASINEHKLPSPIISFGIVAYAFVGQPFSKQLHIYIAANLFHLFNYYISLILIKDELPDAQ